MEKRNIFNRIKERFIIIFSTLGRWFKRAFFGTHRELSLLEEEAIQSPIKVTISKFFHKKLAIIALSMFILIVGFCFVGSALTEGDEMFLDIGQRDTTPGLQLLGVPNELSKTGIKKIATGTTYSIGIDINGKVYFWGSSKREMYEGYYTTTKGEDDFYTKVELLTGKYIPATNDTILKMTDAIKLLNDSELYAVDVYAGPDAFFIVLNDNSVRGFCGRGDSTSTAFDNPGIVTEDVAAKIKETGVYNITMDNQVTALMTNSQEGAEHELFIWGNIGIGKNRTQNPDAIVRELKASNLNPIDARWTRDTLVILFDNGTFKSYGPNDSVVISTQPDIRSVTYGIQIREIEAVFLEALGSSIEGYDEAVKDAQDEANSLKLALAEARLAESKATDTSKKANALVKENENKLKNATNDIPKEQENLAKLETELASATAGTPEYEALEKAIADSKAKIVELELLKAELEITVPLNKAAAAAALIAKEAATAEFARINLEIEKNKADLDLIKDIYADKAVETAKDMPEYAAQYALLEQYYAGKKINDDNWNMITEFGVKQIRATRGGVVTLLNNGYIVTWGDDSSLESSFPKEIQGHVVSLEGDTKGAEKCSHFVAKLDNGKFVVWGSPYQDGIKVPSGLNESGATTIYSNYYQNFAVDEDGHVVEKWGLNGYIFGTDQRGRSIFIRIMHGGKISLTIGLVAVIIAAVVGIIVGGVSGYFGGWVDILMMRLCEIVGSIPFLPIAMTLSLVCNELGFRDTKSKMLMIMLILGLLSWTGLASLIRAHILAEREKEFVVAAQAVGVKTNKIIFRHIIPNVLTIIIISITSSYAGSLLTESSLSFLGFGVEEPAPTWGNMLTGAQNMNVIKDYWWRWVFPSIFLCSTTVSINLIGDCIRDAVDPRSSER